MAKITFVYPDYESLGVEYLMATCLKDGHEVDYIHYHAEDDMCIGKKRKAISFLNIAKRIKNTQPHVVAFSCVIDNYQFQLSCAKAVKEILPQAVIVFGGIHPTAVPEVVLKEEEVDCVSIGEAENSFSDFLKACRFDSNNAMPSHPIKGMVYKAGGKIIGDYKEGELPDLNELPFPYKKPFYSRLKACSREYYVMASRGCPYNCSYCFNSYVRYSRGVGVLRQRSVANVIAELLVAKRNYAPRYITFLDDCFTINDAWLMEFCRSYKKDINLPFACIAIPQYLNKEKIKALNMAGCCHVQIGVQSLNKELCEKILQRQSDNAKIAEAICLLKESGIIVQVDHMLGRPGDTLNIEEDGALFYNRIRPHIISVFWLTYYPKTAIVDIAKQKGILNSEDMVNINEGRSLTNKSLHTGGSIKDPRPYYGICTLLHWIPLLPSWLVIFLIKRKLYNRFLINNTVILVGLPRFLLAILHRRNFRDRESIIRFFR